MRDNGCLMDWQDEEIVCPRVKNLVLGKGILAKSLSDTNIPGSICSVENCECTESLNYSSIMKRLKLENDMSLSNEKIPPISRLRDVQTCICTDCLGQENKTEEFHTREISSLRLVVQGQQILNHQGIKHSSEDVAPYWKKDSRMWLWKSVRLARKRRHKSKSLTRFPSFARAFSGQ